MSAPRGDALPVDDPGVHDNRDYRYALDGSVRRAEYDVIAGLVPAGASVVDFGCGDGSLLQLLRDERGAEGLGFDLSESAVESCRRKGIRAERRAIDQPHPGLGDREFDVAICNVTLQMVMYPEVLLREMLRVARFSVVAIPNFAHLRNRLDLALHGRMPRPGLFGYDWYSTGHIHQASLRDFEELARRLGGRVVRRVPVGGGGGARGLLRRRFPNLLAVVAVYLLEAA